METCFSDNNNKMGKKGIISEKPPTTGLLCQKKMLPNLNLEDYALLAVLFLSEFTRSAFFISFLPLYTTERLGWTIATAGAAASAHFFTETLLKFFAGWQLDRIGRPLLQAGLIVGLLSLVAVRAYSHPALLIISSGLFGLGLSPLWIGVITQVAPINKENRSFRVSLVFIAWLAGIGSGLSVINFFISISYDFAYAIIICFLLSALIVTRLFLPPVPAHKKDNTSPGTIITAFRQIISNRNFSRAILPGMFLQTMSASMLLPVFPVFATQRMGMSPDGYGLLLLAGGFTTMLALIPMGKLADRMNIKIMLFTGFLSSSAALAGLALTRDRHAAFILVLILGLSYGAVLPAWNSLLAGSIPPKQQATGWGLFSAVEGLGMSVGPVVGGFLAGGFSTSQALLGAAGVLSLMAFFYLLYPVANCKV